MKQIKWITIFVLVGVITFPLIDLWSINDREKLIDLEFEGIVESISQSVLMHNTVVIIIKNKNGKKRKISNPWILRKFARNKLFKPGDTLVKKNGINIIHNGKEIRFVANK